VSVISIGHISTTALAAISLGSMTAGVSGYSVIQGLASALDTVLPSAWTSNQPRLVGLWAQRMSQYIFSVACVMSTDSVITQSCRHLRVSCSKSAGQVISPTDSISQPTVLVWLNAESILLFLNQEPEVAHLAAVYLRWASLGLPGMALTSAFLRCS
jgi:MATE family multidrug resistance protein